MSEGFWILIAIFVFLVFGKNLNLGQFSINTGNSNNVPPGQFTQPNAVPTADGIPAISIQNQTTPPENQPAPWKSICQPTTVNPVQSLATGAVPVQGKTIVASAL